MANPADDQRSQPVVARVVRRLTPQYRPMRRPLSTFVRLSAGGDWIRTISSARADSDVRIVDYRVEAAELRQLFSPHGWWRGPQNGSSSAGGRREDPPFACSASSASRG